MCEPSVNTTTPPPCRTMHDAQYVYMNAHTHAHKCPPLLSIPFPGRTGRQEGITRKKYMQYNVRARVACVRLHILNHITDMNRMHHLHVHRFGGFRVQR